MKDLNDEPKAVNSMNKEWWEDEYEKKVNGFPFAYEKDLSGYLNGVVVPETKKFIKSLLSSYQ
jgi:hypothetical protein